MRLFLCTIFLLMAYIIPNRCIIIIEIPTAELAKVKAKGGRNMQKQAPLVITISRQLGSGGAYIGQQLAKGLDIGYWDREIISQAARQLSVLEEDLEARDEKIPSFWQNFLQLGGFSSFDLYIPPQIYMLNDWNLYKVEAEIIKRIGCEQSAIIIGRCGSYVLRDHPNHVSIFLHASREFRRERLHYLYQVSLEEAGKMIAQSDKDRARYHQAITSKEWNDARQYDLAIDTGQLGVDNAVLLIRKYLESVKRQ